MRSTVCNVYDRANLSLSAIQSRANIAKLSAGQLYNGFGTEHVANNLPAAAVPRLQAFKAHVQSQVSNRMELGRHIFHDAAEKDVRLKF